MKLSCIKLGYLLLTSRISIQANLETYTDKIIILYLKVLKVMMMWVTWNSASRSSCIVAFSWPLLACHQVILCSDLLLHHHQHMKMELCNVQAVQFKTSALIGAWKCNFPAFFFFLTDLPTDQLCNE